MELLIRSRIIFPIHHNLMRFSTSSQPMILYRIQNIFNKTTNFCIFPLVYQNKSICNNLKLMEKLKQAQELSIKADHQYKQKHYQQSVAHYKRIIEILQAVLLEPFAKNSLQEIKSKIQKYSNLKRVAEGQLHPQHQIIVKKLEKVIIDHHHGNHQIVQKQVKNNYSNQRQHVSSKKQIEPQKQRIINDKYQTNNHRSMQNIAYKKQVPRVKPSNPIVNPSPIQKRNNQKQINPVKKIELPKKIQVKKPIPKYPKQIQIEPQVKDLIIKKIDVNFDDIVGLKDVKVVLEQAVIRPRKRPDLYQGIRAPPRGLLLYGPPGNGKTYICKALAHQSGCTFFAISASSIMNKYLGQSQKMIKKIFAAAQKLAPSIIFIDQIDSMLTARSEHEHQASRRLKTEFLVLMDGITSPKSGEIIVIGATNLPKELDSAAKRRFSKFIYIGNPDPEACRQLLLRNLKEVSFQLTERQMDILVQQLDGYSASQIRNIIVEVCNQPLREISDSKFEKVTNEELRKVGFKDFTTVLKQRKPIVSKEELQKFKAKI